MTKLNLQEINSEEFQDNLTPKEIDVLVDLGVLDDMEDWEAYQKMEKYFDTNLDNEIYEKYFNRKTKRLEFKDELEQQLFYLIKTGEIEKIKELIENSKKINKEQININAENGEAFYLAVINGHVKIMDFLLSLGATPDLNESLYYACQKENIMVIEFLLNFGAQLEEEEDNLPKESLVCIFHYNLNKELKNKSNKQEIKNKL